MAETTNWDEASDEDCKAELLRRIKKGQPKSALAKRLMEYVGVSDDGIPQHPDFVYSLTDEWQGWDDFLGTNTGADQHADAANERLADYLMIQEIKQKLGVSTPEEDLFLGNLRDESGGKWKPYSLEEVREFMHKIERLLS